MIPTGMDSVKEREKLVIAKEESIEAYKAYTWGDYYPNQWKFSIKGSKAPISFNFSAFLFTYRWCFFRKLNKLGLMLFTFELLLLSSGFILVEHFEFQPLVAIYAVTSGMLAMMTFAGFYANWAYFKHTQNAIKSYINSRLPDVYFGEALRSDGGTSMGNLLIFAALNILFISLPKIAQV
ncbi:DUF2628 domain-containing protein [Vibrio sp. Of7-15]|uniref:DUF2628 domain-containing protein n=1 Tax=Vibrio sp. Of7-15 TaxID=2724879 RepID=UPI001EF1D829|nr:DUF2628 domain-containing protein [Vibrio sp. Of7-15]MCG7499710.1 DUF2628 domain-containing protein [Vibrio sp. Of7-15]